MLNALIFLPLLAGVFSFSCNKSSIKPFAVFASLGFLLLNYYLFITCTNSGFFHITQFNLAPVVGLQYAVAFDSTAALLSLLSSLMVFLSFLALDLKSKSEVACIFILQTCMIGLFAATDVLIFYVFWEASLLPMIYLMGRFGVMKTGIKFFVYAFFGSIFMLVAILYIGGILCPKELGYMSFLIQDWLSLKISFKAQAWLFLAFFLAFAIKSPLFPLHTWAPAAYTKAPILVSVMLVGFKMAPFGFLRYCLPLFPDAIREYSLLLLSLCVISAIYAGLIAFKLKNIKQIVTYSSISHIGIMLLGLFAMSDLGVKGAVFYMFAHGLVTGLLFICGNIIYNKTGTFNINHLGGIAQEMPLFTFFFALLLFASISLPFTISFVGEFIVLLAAFKANAIIGILATFMVVIGAVYMLNVFRLVFFKTNPNSRKITSASLSKGEILALSLGAILVIYLGIHPNPFLDIIYTTAILR